MDRTNLIIITEHNNGAVLLYLLLILIFIFIGKNSFVSHSSSLQSWSLLGIMCDFIHSIAVSIWIGGLMYISYVFLPNVNSITTIISKKIQQFSSHPKSITLLILAKFSLVSTISIGIIGITGLSLAWLHIRTADELLISDYGRVLIIKLCIALPVVLMGVYHQLWIAMMLNFLCIKKIENRKIFDTKFSQNKLDSIKLTIEIETLLMI
jgi:copper transport protein